MSEQMQILAQLVSSLGFPIVMVGVVIWLFYDLQKWNRENSLRWQEAITNNTKVMERLVATLDKGGDD